MRSLLNFLGEPYAAECLEPLARRVNSSDVPVHFNVSDAAIDPAIVKRARQLSDELQNSPQQRDASASVAKKLEAEFNQQVQYSYDLGRKFGEAQKLITRLRKDSKHVEPSAIATDGLHKRLSRRPTEILKRILSGKPRR